ncbi:interleukin-11-like [Huso huso]|uniref:Interleukin-11-like n=1 Tax=Huso huso TaxID=61971 RepID=A0ABR0Y850_HUSHU
MPSSKSHSDADGDHKLDSLPVLSVSATNLSTAQVKSTLSKLLSDLFSYEKHFDWLRRVSERPHHGHLPKVGGVLTHIRNMIASLQHQMIQLNVPRPPPPSPSLPPPHPPVWEAVQTAHAILKSFRLFSDWSVRALLSLSDRL